MAIRFIYFDLGNVLLTFDHHRATRRLAECSGIDASVFDSEIFQSGLQVAYETGDIDSQQFATAIAQRTGCTLPASQILTSCSDIFCLNTEIVAVVAGLKAAGFRMGILSNTCDAHWQFIKRQQYALFDCFFEISVLSFESRCMKPDRKIYADAIEAAGVRPEQIFFTDDREENVAGARDAGMNATTFLTVTQLIRDLHRNRVMLAL